MKITTETKTFPDRLKASIPQGCTLGHKTGTSGSWNGITPTNDVGILTAPDGSRISLAVFIADSRASDKERAALMAKISRIVVEHFTLGGAGN